MVTLGNYAKTILVYQMPLTVRETAVYQALEAAIAGKPLRADLVEALNELCDLYEAKAPLAAIETAEELVERAWVRQGSN